MSGTPDHARNTPDLSRYATGRVVAVVDIENPYFKLSLGGVVKKHRETPHLSIYPRVNSLRTGQST